MGVPDYRQVTFKNKEYCVCKIEYKGKDILFVIDSSDIDKVLEYSWHIASIHYIGTSSYEEDKILYLHNFVMNKLTFNGKGQKSSVDHINRIGTDDRKENLRVITQSKQNENQGRRSRKMKLPSGSNITTNDIPKNVEYRKPAKRGNRICGDLFTVHIKNIENMDDIRWSSIASKDVSLKFKLEHTKKYLRYLRDKHPKMFASRNIGSRHSRECIASMKDYNEILRLSEYDCVKDNLVRIPRFKDLLKEDTKGLTAKEIELLKTISVTGSNGRKSNKTLPDDCNITIDMIPEYCYFRNESKNSGNAFVIDKKHPKMNGKSWCTSRSRSVSIDEKFEQLLTKLKELE